MKAIILAAMAVSGAANTSATDVSGFRYERSLAVPAATGQACTVLDAGVFAHANSQTLDDLRVYRRDSSGLLSQVPFRFSISDTQTTEDDVAPVINFRGESRTMDFDLSMPSRPYSAVTLNLAAKDFVGTAIVSGKMTPNGAGTALGTFAVFDLTSQHLSRSTTLQLEESSFPLLHVQLRLRGIEGEPMLVDPNLLHQAVVPPSRQAQRVYSVVASSGFHREGTDSVAMLHLPEHVPMERVRFIVSPQFSNFQREVDVFAIQDGDSATESAHGTISRVKLAPSSGESMPIDSQDLSIDTAFAANFRSAATIRVVVHNGGGPPLPLQTLNVEMRQRQICFDVAPDTQYVAFYGNAENSAEKDTFSALQVEAHPLAATMGPEVANPAYKSRSSSPGMLARQPDLMWVCSAGVLAILGSVALRRRRTRHS